MLKVLLRPEIFIYISIVLFTSAFFVLNLSTNDVPDNALGAYYLQLNGDKIAWSAVLILFVLFIRAIFWWVVTGFRGIDPALVFSRQKIYIAVSALLKFFKDALLVGIPFLLAFYSLTQALGQLNVFNKARLQDELLVQWDFFLTHTFPSFSLASVYYPPWFVEAVGTSFFYLIPALALLAAYLFQAKQKLFREAAGAFFASAVIMFAGWILFPVLSPHDRFIDNVYRLPTPPAIQEYVDNYHPQEEIRSFLEGMRKSKEGLSVLPTSAFPSAHVAWAVLLVYYSYNVRKWLIIFAVPFAIFSTLGTTLFAQHYFVDIPAGIIAGMISIFIAHWLAKKNENLLVHRTVGIA